MFKDLNINRSMILNSIDEFCKGNFKDYKRTDIIERGPTRRRVDLECDGKKLYIDFQYRTGGTTIETHGGNHLDIKKELATYIINDSSCKIKNLNNRDSKFIAEGILEEDFNSIIDLIKESNYYKDDSHKKYEYHYQYTFKGVYNEKLTVSYYFTRDKIMLQGRPLLLFYDAVTLITELLDPSNIPEVFNNMYELNIDKQNIIDQYDMYFPNSSEKHGEKLKSSLYQCIYNLNIKADMFSYEGFALPAFRALEGHLKKILFEDYSIECENNKFTMFKFCKLDNKSSLKECHIENINNETVINYFNDTYNYFCSQRNSLVHWDSPNEYDPDSETTRVIEDLKEVESIIRNILSKIDEYYLLKG